jgi:hypothetical protein
LCRNGFLYRHDAVRPVLKNGSLRTLGTITLFLVIKIKVLIP